ncbi:MAG: hypothetical protein SOW21_09735 [[Actinobacillus] rossii]|uniref:Uncharacterized protein n=1 Tax=[Actinobacillus] rossii TaxID=123820 RepID=A0A380TM13_9PAST|nr:hypothetical protein [[Actinobacillus] rossii]SUT88043.1 Uncharacterised protein [[Actinobacillus] rossii]
MYQIRIKHQNGKIEMLTAESQESALAKAQQIKARHDCIIAINPTSKTICELVFVYSNGEQEDVGEYYSLKDAIKAKEQAKNRIGKADILGRVLSAVSIIKKDCL